MTFYKGYRLRIVVPFGKLGVLFGQKNFSHLVMHLNITSKSFKFYWHEVYIKIRSFTCSRQFIYTYLFHLEMILAMYSNGP